MRYEVFISPGLGSCEVEAESELEARRQFVQTLRDNLDVEHFEATALDDEPETEVCDG